MEPPTYLAEKNQHPRDKCITFDEGPHIYTIDGDSDFMSVTRWNHSHFDHFDADKIIDKMMMGRNWGPANKYWGMSKMEIKKMWKDNGIAASTAGTKMHYDIECYYNDMEVEVEDECVEWKYFEKFEEEVGGIKKDNRWQSALTDCIKHLPDCNYYHYCLQLNTYKALLEKNYGEKIKDMYLVCLHPNNENKSYQLIKVLDLQKEVKDLFNLRRKMLYKELKNEATE